MLAVFTMLAQGSPAMADDGHGGAWTRFTPTSQQQAFLNEKMQLVNELTQVDHGQLPKATYDRDVAAFNQRHGIKHQLPAHIRLNQAVQPATCIDTCIPGSFTLSNFQHDGQTKDYYCGPASAQMVLGWLGYSVSQTTLAGSSYLRTDANGGTNYGDNVMAPTLNTLGNTGGFYAQQNDTNLTDYENNMKYDIANYWPVVIAAHETSTYRLNPISIGWYHWYDIRGYASSGATSAFDDPAYPMFAVTAQGTTPSSNVVGMMAGFGYAW